MVTFKLYQNDGTTLIYTFPIVFSANYPHSQKNLIEHTSPRGKGSLVVDGGQSAWDLIIKGVIKANGYVALMSIVDTMESLVALNTPYVLTITGGYSYNVKRLVSITYQDDNLRTNYLEYSITFRVSSW